MSRTKAKFPIVTPWIAEEKVPDLRPGNRTPVGSKAAGCAQTGWHVIQELVVGMGAAWGSAWQPVPDKEGKGFSTQLRRELEVWVALELDRDRGCGQQTGPPSAVSFRIVSLPQFSCQGTMWEKRS